MPLPSLSPLPPPPPSVLSLPPPQRADPRSHTFRCPHSRRSCRCTTSPTAPQVTNRRRHMDARPPPPRRRRRHPVGVATEARSSTGSGSRCGARGRGRGGRHARRRDGERTGRGGGQGASHSDNHGVSPHAGRSPTGVRPTGGVARAALRPRERVVTTLDEGGGGGRAAVWRAEAGGGPLATRPHASDRAWQPQKGRGGGGRKHLQRRGHTLPAAAHAPGVAR